MEKKILRRIAEHIAAVQIINMMGTVTEDIGLTEDELDYVQHQLEKIGSRLTSGDLNFGSTYQIVNHWKALIHPLKTSL